jgi:hypothetical protein
MPGPVTRVAATLVVALGICAAVVTPAGASTLTPCPKPPVAAKYEGEGTLVSSANVSRALRRVGIRQRLILPANGFTGRPTYPLGKVGLGRKAAAVSLRGGIRLLPARRGRATTVTGLKVVARSGARPVVNGRVSGRWIRVFNLRGAKLRRNLGTGAFSVSGGTALLSGTAARIFRQRLGLRPRGTISAGRPWGRFSVFAFRNNKVKDPEAETPIEPPILERPAGAEDITSASIKWRVRESFIRYVAVGAGTSVSAGATADPPEVFEGAAPLTYSFNFQFTDGWTAGGTGPSAIHGGGKVGFRHCQNTINFTVADPELELNGDSLSRLIFRVDGTDGTAFPNSRAVMVDLVPSLATRSVAGNTTTLTGIPAYVPQEATGIFADFYPPYPGSPDDPAAAASRFGSVTVSYTTG